MEFVKEGWGVGTSGEVLTDGAGGTAAGVAVARAAEMLAIEAAGGVAVACRSKDAAGETFCDGIDTAAGGTAFGGPNPGGAAPLCSKIMFLFMLESSNGS
ncbi:unnamed protein product [Toxocara canis]|uniref:Uncharacterized protein n=1 Tax=Toxocara canis TaxID=6265 RepID=A0A183UIW1_TOXCA|nr:unnamed protein product [Toxocara canis]